MNILSAVLRLLFKLTVFVIAFAYAWVIWSANQACPFFRGYCGDGMDIGWVFVWFLAPLGVPALIGAYFIGARWLRW